MTAATLHTIRQNLHRTGRDDTHFVARAIDGSHGPRVWEATREVFDASEPHTTSSEYADRIINTMNQWELEETA